MTDTTNTPPRDDLDPAGDGRPGRGGNGIDLDPDVGDWPRDDDDEPTVDDVLDLHGGPTPGAGADPYDDVSLEGIEGYRDDPSPGGYQGPITEPSLDDAEDLLDEPTLNGYEDLYDDADLDPEIQIQTEPPVHLHLAPTRGYRPAGPLWMLARTMGLPVWGSDFLSRRASMEMQAAAALLLVLFCFELGAWSLLANCMVHGANFLFSPLTALAVTIACFFASAVFLFERGVIVADFSVEPARKALGVVIRIGVIGLSAVACAQPLELVLFDRPIEGELYKEEYTRIAVQSMEDYFDAKEQARPVTTAEIEAEVAQTRAHGEWQQNKQSRDAAAIAVRVAEADLEQAKLEQAKWDSSLRTWRTRYSTARADLRADPENPTLIAAQDKARRNRAWADTKLAEANALVSGRTADVNKARSEQEYWTGQVTTASQELDTAETEIVGRLNKGTDQGQADLDQIKARIDVLMAGSPDAPPIDPATGKDFVWANHGFTDRLAVIHRLIHGQPTRWPATSPEVREAVVESFGLPDPAEEAIGAQQTANTYMRHYIVAFLIALAIPLLSIAFKIIMPREFRNYLSTEWQALAGNPEAVREILARPGGRQLLARLQGVIPETTRRRWPWGRRG